MPEGPEVTLMVAPLTKKFKGSKLKEIEIVSGRYVRHGVPKKWKAFHNKLPAKIVDISNKGKMVWLQLDNGYYVKIVPAMTGHLEMEPDKYNRLKFVTSNGDFFLNDMRNFATIHFLSKDEFEKEINGLGPFPLAKGKVDIDEVLERFRRKSQGRMVADVMLDQDVMAGVGNYIRSDALYVAGISPLRTLKSLTDAELKKIIRASAKVMIDSYNLQKRGGPYYYPAMSFKIYRRDDVATDKTKIKGRHIWWNREKQK